MTYKSQASSIIPFPPRSSPTLISPPVRIGVPIVTNHLQTNIDAVVERMYRMKGNVPGKNDRLLIKDIKYRITHVPAYSVSHRMRECERETNIDDK